MACCRECGLLGTDDRGGLSCAKYARDEVSLDAIRECSYFMPVQMDGERPFSPQEHLALKEEEFRRRRMQGPV